MSVYESFRVDCAAVHGICLMGCGWTPIDAGCLVCALDESYCQGFSSLACCIRQNQLIGEVMRRAAKNTEGVTDFFVRGPWRKSTLLPPIAIVPNVNGHSLLLDSFARVQAALSLQMSRNVYKCIRMSRQFQFFGTLFCVLPNSSSLSLMETERTFWGIHSVSADRFHLPAFLGRGIGFSTFTPRLSTMWARQGYFLDSGNLSRPCPKSMQLS